MCDSSKLCKRCGFIKPLTQFSKRKSGHFLTCCKTCRALIEKERRDNNPEKAKLASQLSYKKNGWKDNLKRKEKYHHDISYRESRLLKDKLYTATGKRNELYHANAEVCRKRSYEYKKRNKDKVKKYYTNYRKDVFNKVEQDNRDALDDSYLIKVIKKQTNHSIKTEQIPKSLIDLKRNTILLKRQIKTKQNDQANTNV